jgi:hypothetical protein
MLCTGLWGGMYNAVLPVQDSIDEIINSLSIDVLVSVEESETAEAIKERFSHLRWRTYPFDEPLVTEALSGGSRQFRLADISYPCFQYWWDEGRHAQSSHGTLPVWPAGHSKEAFYAVSFGAFPKEQDEIPDLSDVFSQAFRATVADLSAASPDASWVRAMTPIKATRLGLSLWGRHSPFGPGLVVGDPTKASHLMAFWNLRATGYPVLFCPTDGPGDWSDFFRESLRPFVAPSSGDMDNWCTYWVCTDAPEDDIDVATSITDLTPDGFKAVLSVLPVYGWRREPFVVRPQTDMTTVLASIDDRFGTKFISVIPNRPFAEARRQLAQRRQRWFVCFRPYSMLDLAEGWTLKLPYVEDLNDWFSRTISLASPGGLRVQPDGFDVVDDVMGETMDLSAVPSYDLVRQLLTRASLTMTLSPPGQIAQRVLDMTGGRHQARVFRIRGVRRLLESSKARTGLAFSHAVELIRDRDAETREASFDRFKDLAGRDATPESVFRLLLQWEVFRPQLALKCPNCKLTTSIDPDSIGTRVTCTLCTHVFLLGPHVSGKEWRYRVSGVFERESGPEGVVSTLLAWGELDRAGGLGDELILLPAHDLNGEGLHCETDLIAVEIAPVTGFPSFCVAECKTNGRIGAEDLANLADVRRRLRNEGFECHIVLAILRSAFDDGELEMLREFTVNVAKSESALGLPFYELREASPLILFTRAELEANTWTSAPVASGAPHDYPRSFRDLAENSKVVHLGLPLSMRYKDA